ncbi:MAG: hypothetical protein ACR2KP_11035 [Egibacteraceae bacterium]|jgi:hypothetical protein
MRDVAVTTTRARLAALGAALALLVAGLFAVQPAREAGLSHGERQVAEVRWNGAGPQEVRWNEVRWNEVRWNGNGTEEVRWN